MQLLSRLVRACAPLLLLAPLARADVIVVDDSGGGDHLDIHTAVLAAQEGDVLLVKAGTYGPVGISAKGLQIVAEDGAFVEVLGGVQVLNTAPAQTVVLAGLRISGINYPFGNHPSMREALLVHSAAGPVRVERCTLAGAPGVYYGAPLENGGDGVLVQGAADLSLTRCDVRGGDGEQSFSSFAVNFGGDALDAAASSVALHDSALRGGHGGPGDFNGCDLGGPGGHGARIDGATLFASGTSFAGGDGGGDGFFSCEPGGDGLLLSGGASQGFTLGVTAQGGAGACGAPDGVPFRTVAGATLTQLPGSARRFASQTPVRAGQTAQMTFEGLPGDQANLLITTQAAFAIALPWNGVRLVQLPLTLGRRLVGFVPPSGVLQVALPMPALPAGLESRTLMLQAIFQDTGGAYWLASPSALVILDPSF